MTGLSTVLKTSLEHRILNGNFSFIGSGKTFTMMGSPDSPGLIPRICKEMFNRMRLGKQSGTGYKTSVSYLEIYNERVKDLLGTSNNAGHGLRVREHQTLGPYVEDLSQHPVADYRAIQVNYHTALVMVLTNLFNCH